MKAHANGFKVIAIVLGLGILGFGGLGLPVESAWPKDKGDRAAGSPKATANKSDGPAQSSAKSSTVVWDAWYAVIANGSVPYGAYHERVEQKSGKIALQLDFCKKEEGFYNEESLGAFAKDNSELTPLFFNFRSAYRSHETTIDGTIDDNRLLTVRIRKSGKEQPTFRKTIAKGTIFSSMFPVLLKAHLAADGKANKTRSFLTLVEDKSNEASGSISGSFVIDKDGKAIVNYGSQKSIWHMDKDGIATKIQFPSTGAEALKVPRDEAKKLVGEGCPGFFR